MAKNVAGAKKNGDTFRAYVQNGDAEVWGQDGFDDKSSALKEAKKQAATRNRLRLV